MVANDRIRGVKTSKVKTVLITIPSRHGVFMETINFTFIAPLRSISGLAHCCVSTQNLRCLGSVSTIPGNDFIFRNPCSIKNLLKNRRRYIRATLDVAAPIDHSVSR